MKKTFLAMIFATSIFSVTTVNTQAAERLDLADIVYPNSEKTEYYSLELLDYASNFTSFSKGANNFTHIRLTNNQAFTLNDYASEYVAASRESKTNMLARGLDGLVKNVKPEDIKIVQGKFENGKVIAAEPTVKEFKVVDIK